MTQMPQTTLVFPTQIGSTQNFTLIGQAVSEKMFGIVGGRADAGAKHELKLDFDHMTFCYFTY